MSSHIFRQKDSSEPQRSKNEPGANNPNQKGPAPDIGLPSFISQILEQYQMLLVSQVERELKSKILSALKEEMGFVGYRAQERLRAMEMEMEQRIQSVLDGAREKVFTVISEEMDNVVGKMQVKIETLEQDAGNQNSDPKPSNAAVQQQVIERILMPEFITVPAPAPNSVANNTNGADSAQKTPENKEEEQQEETKEEPLDLLRQLQAEAENDESDLLEQDKQRQVVCLELRPPLYLKSLLGFYRGLIGMKSVRVLRALGSVGKGVYLYVRPKEPGALLDLLKNLPGVNVVEEDATNTQVVNGKGQSDENQLTYRIMLTPTG